MKKKALGIASLVLVGSIIVGSASVFAADIATRNTDAQVKFVLDNSKTDPVDPLDPDKPVKPVDPTNPGTPVSPGSPGPLSLDYASILDFGENMVSTSAQTYYAKPQKVILGDTSEKDVPNYAQVTDKRGGDSTGWALSVKQNGQFKLNGTGAELTGAQITFMNGQFASTSGAVTPSKLKTTFALGTTGTGVEVTVANAKKGEGLGTWVYRFGDDTTKDKSIKLDVPANVAQVGTYKTSLTWTLKDVPLTDAEFEAQP